MSDSLGTHCFLNVDALGECKEDYKIDLFHKTIEKSEQTFSRKCTFKINYSVFAVCLGIGLK